MALSTIKSNLKTALEAVTGIGQVHDYIRNWSGTNKTFFHLFESSKKVHAWQITRRKTPEKGINTNNSNERRHEILIFGVYGVNDLNASEKTFQDLIEAICVKLRDEAKQPAPLSGAVLRMGWPQVETVEFRFWNGRLVHACDIGLWVDEYIIIP